MQRFEPLSGDAWRRFARGRTTQLGWHFEPASPEVVARFSSMFIALRWGTLSLAMGLGLVERTGRHAAIAGACLAVYTLLRTLLPIHYDRADWRLAASLVLEVAVCVVVVDLTGIGASPFLVSLVMATAITGFAGGFRLASGLALLAGLAIVVPSLTLASYGGDAGFSVQFAVELVLVAVLGAFSRHFVEDARRTEEGLGTSAEHLSEVNDLLLDLHRATASEPTPLDLDGAARWALERLEELFSPDISAVLLRDPATELWQLVAGTGVRSTEHSSTLEVPAAVASAAAVSEPVSFESLDQGLNFRSRRGLYCALRVRDELVGVLAVEWRSAGHTTPTELRRIGDLARAAALALDNARWLERIHSLGVEEERSRLARELHDHIGQSVVYLGFEIDRLVQLNEGRAVQEDLIALRGDVRNLVEELRDALVDLRSDVSETQGVDTVLRSFLDRVNRRNRLQVTLTADGESRLPLSVEREFWRVAQEAVMNAERHAHASKVQVLWLCNADGALLEVSDDGVGLSAGTSKGASSYGLLGMRERADSVGAQLDITSGPERGTMVRMRMKVA